MARRRRRGTAAAAPRALTRDREKPRGDSGAWARPALAGTTHRVDHEVCRAAVHSVRVVVPPEMSLDTDRVPGFCVDNMVHCAPTKLSTLMRRRRPGIRRPVDGRSQRRSMKTLSIQRPLPSIDICTPACFSTEVTGELASLIGVEDLRTAVPGQRLLQGFDTEVAAQGVRQMPGECRTRLTWRRRSWICMKRPASGPRRCHWS